jgi:RNA polymerase sigma-70 factor (ECF subfamily)
MVVGPRSLLVPELDLRNDGPVSASPLRLVSRSDSADPEPVLDPADFEQVFRRFAPYVARVGVRILGPGDEIEDLVQDVFLDAHRGLSALEDASKVRHWLAAITVRKSLRRLRRRRLLRFIGFESEMQPDAVLVEAGQSEDRAWILAVYRILDTADPADRIAWVMNRVEGEALERVAEVCRCSRATAHRRVQKVQAMLEKGLGHVDR